MSEKEHIQRVAMDYLQWGKEFDEVRAGFALTHIKNLRDELERIKDNYEHTISCLLMAATNGKWSKVSDKDSMVRLIEDEIEEQINGTLNEFHSEHLKGGYVILEKKLDRVKQEAKSLKAMITLWEERNRESVEELERVKQELAEKDKALEFYADSINWSISKEHTEEVQQDSKHTFIGCYTRIWKDHYYFMDNFIGGRRARDVLIKWVCKK